MLVTVEDLRKGDVVIIGGNGGNIIEAKLLRQPQQATTGKLKTWWGVDRWKSVLCAVREEDYTRTYTSYNGQTSKHVYKKLVVANGQPYTKEKRVDFTGKEVWLIKRENHE